MGYRRLERLHGIITGFNAHLQGKKMNGYGLTPPPERSWERSCSG
jgi:hypothetical protein